MARTLNNEAVAQPQFGTYQARAPIYRGTTTRSVYIPLRDGARLAAEIILPETLPPDEKIPALLSQTRYWRAMELRAPFKWLVPPETLDPFFWEFKPFFSSHGYAIVIVDVRGTGASFGAWPYPWTDESVEDAREIVDWIVSQPWSDGNVGGYGISYLGTTAELLATLDHPAVKAVIPMFNHPDAYTDIAFPGGVFDRRFIKMWSHFDHKLDQNNLPREFGVLGRLLIKGVKPVDADGGRQLLREAVRDHANNGDVYRLAQSVDFRDDRPVDHNFSVNDIAVHRFKDAIERSSTAIFGWASWMDAGTADAVLRRFLTFENAHRAVIGAWEHGGRFHASPYQTPNLPSDPPLPAQWQEMMRFFDCYLKDQETDARSDRILHYYTMGEEKWKTTSVWPPFGTKTNRWYFAANALLSPDEPVEENGDDTYAVDFLATTGQNNRWWEMGVLERKTVVYPDRAVDDQRLLVYSTLPLAEDVEITGYPVVTLYVTSTEEDGAVFVYLEDVDEMGRVIYITESQLRVIHRKVSVDTAPYDLQVPYHSFKRKDNLPLVPGEIAEITFGLNPTSVLIKQGHRIRVAIAGHDDGTFARVPEEGTPILTVMRNKLHPSHIDLPTVARA